MENQKITHISQKSKKYIGFTPKNIFNNTSVKEFFGLSLN